MFGFGLFEILFLFALALIVIGPKQLPEVARAAGKLLNELKRLTAEVTNSMETTIHTPHEDYAREVRSDEPSSVSCDEKNENGSCAEHCPLHTASQIPPEIAAQISQNLPLEKESSLHG